MITRTLAALTLALLGALAHASTPYPPQSIYHLAAPLTNQDGVEHGLDVHRGHPVLITMFYGSCPMACPLLIDSLRALEAAVPSAQRAQLRVLMVSIDPQHDTVAALNALTEARRLDGARWSLTRTDEASVRKLAAVLNIQYRELPQGGYNHSSIITLLSPTGEIVAQSSMLGKADPALVEAIGRLE